MASTRVQWEYRTLRPPRGETKKESEDPQAELNDLGEEGWELTETIEYTGGGTKFLVFKRPVETTPDANDGAEEGTEADGRVEEDGPS